MSAEGGEKKSAEGGEKKKLSLGAKAKSFFGGVKDALKDAATIDLTFDNEEGRLKGAVQVEGAAKDLCIFSHEVSCFAPALLCLETSLNALLAAGRSIGKGCHRSEVSAVHIQSRTQRCSTSLACHRCSSSRS